MKRKLLFLAVLMSSCMFLHAQDNGTGDGTQKQVEYVTGTVTSFMNNGQPLEFASVSVKGTTRGVVTDANGKYRIKIPKGGKVLIFQYFGMEVEERVITDSVMDIKLTLDVEMVPDVFALDELVVTAIAIEQANKEIGYSVQEIKSEEINNVQHTNVVNAIASKAAGVQVTSSAGTPGGSSYITIRGRKSLLLESQPLFVVDGIPIDNSYNYTGNPDDGGNNLLQGVAHSNRAIDINPEDIENITVLKGPAATALYGMKGANGVIVITTKQGKNMGDKKGMSVSFSGSVTFDKVNKLPELQDKFSQGTGWYDYNPQTYQGTDSVWVPTPTYYGPETGWLTSWGPPISDLRYDGDPTYDYDTKGALDPSNTGAVATPYDNVGNFFQTAMTTSNNWAISGGGENSTYRLSIGDVNSEGIVPNTNFRKTSVKLAVSSIISDKLKSTSSINYIKSGGARAEQGSNTSGVMLGLLRTPITFDNANGLADPVGNSASYLFADGSQRNYRGGGGYDNPYWTVNQNLLHDNVNRLIAYNTLSYDAKDWLNLTHRIGTDMYSDRRNQTYAIGSRTLPNGRIYEHSIYNEIINSDFIASANKEISDNLSTSVMVGNNVRSDYSKDMFQQGDDLSFTGFNNMSVAQSTRSIPTDYRYLSYAFYGTAKFNYKDYLFLDFTGRKEWASSLPSESNGFFYPSLSAGYVFTDMLGMDTSKVLQYGKFRVSYATAANVPPVYVTSTTYELANFADGWTNGINFPSNGIGGYSRSNTMGNNALRPELTKSFETGFDLKFFDNKVGLDVTFYNAISSDLLLPVDIAASSGYLAQWQNAGSVQNRGIEAVLNLTPINNEDKKLRWDVGVNFTRNRSKVLAISGDQNVLFVGGFAGTAIQHEVGQPFGMIYGGRWLRDDNGNRIISDDPDGVYDDPNNIDYTFYGYPVADNEEGILGDPNPDFLAGIRNTFQIKNLTFNCWVDIKKGGDMWNGTLGALTFFGMSSNTADRNYDYSDDNYTTFDGVYGHIASSSGTDANGVSYEAGDIVHYATDGSGAELAGPGAANTTPVALNEDWYTDNGGGFGVQAEDFIQDASYTRLREISIGYTFGEEFTKKTPFTNIGISFIGKNLLLFTKYTGVDPETSLVGANAAQGLDYFNMPNTKSYGVKLNLTF